MVELSCHLSLPGAQAQPSHSDMAFSGSRRVLSAFIALQPLTEQMGPTCVVPGTHTRSFHRRMLTQPSSKFYGVEGVLETAEESACNRDALACAQPRRLDDETALEFEAVKNALVAEAQTCVLECGDVLFFDARLFHYGGANQSQVPRCLLNLSFQPADDGRIAGFTYHRHASARALRLGDFPALATLV
jgi:ectoine hydroxylase-related dioxygenase (phytanoyl-CoA dioxygenase family)